MELGTQIGPRNMAVVTHGCDDKSVFDYKEADNRRKWSKGATKANILCSGCGSSTHKRPTHRDSPFNSAAIVDSEGGELSVATASSGKPESDSLQFQPPTGGLCTCGSSGTTCKRECPLSLRKCFPQQRASPSSDHVPIEQKTPSPTKDVRPHMKVGDHVVHSRFMGSSHLPCRIVMEFDGRYQLYCAKGVLINSFCAIELTPLASGSVISLENWRKAPKVLLQSAADDTTPIVFINRNVPSSFDCAEISSASKGESEAPRYVGKLWCLHSESQ